MSKGFCSFDLVDYRYDAYVLESDWTNLLERLDRPKWIFNRPFRGGKTD